MLQLGLGLEVDKGGYVKPLPKWLTDAGCTFAINVDRQVKANVPALAPRTLPNGVQNAPYLKRVGDDYTLVAGDITNLTFGTNIDYVRVKPPVNVIAYNSSAEISRAISTTFSIPAEVAYNDLVSLIGKHCYGSATWVANEFIYVVAKGTYPNLAAAQAALAGTVIRYQLATPVDIVNSPLQNPLTDVTGKLGKNLFDPVTILQGGLLPESGVVSTSLMARVHTNLLKFNPLTQLKLKINSTDYKIRNWSFYNNGTFVLQGNADTQLQEASIVFPSNANEVRVSFCKNVLTDNLTPQEFQLSQTQLELGTVATTYEPYGFNNILMQSAAGTTADGYVQVALPNGKTPYFFKFDGTDTYGIMANNADVDILGTNDFAISTVFMTGATNNSLSVFAKSEDGTLALTQYQLAIFTGNLRFRLNGESLAAMPDGIILPNTLYHGLFYRKSGVLKMKVNEVERYSQANVSNVVSRPNLRIGAISNNSAGTTHTSYSNVNLGNLAIFYKGATGLDIVAVEKAIVKLNANYL